MIFTIEPMINQGKRHLRMMGDGWTVATKDRSLSAHGNTPFWLPKPAMKC
jgi:methionine aminopeptidase